MKELFGAALMVVAVAAGASAQSPWGAVLKAIPKQVVRVEARFVGESSDALGTMCSGVVINKAQGFVMTAAHCVARLPNQRMDLTVAGRAAVVMVSNTMIDLAILKTALRDEIAMPLATAEPEPGTEVYLAGFAFGGKTLHIQHGNISATRDEDYLWIAGEIIIGDSGGAVVNVKGELVGMIAAVAGRGTGHLGVAIPIGIVHDYVDEFLKMEK